MKKFLVLLLLTLAQAHLFSQTLPKSLNQANWQQNVNYVIEVSLNDSAHALSAFEKITYTNNSPNSLSIMYIHLWPNAYKNRNTAYAKQEIENQHTLFYFADEADRGYIDSLDFKVNGQSVKWEFTENIDIALIHLNEPLSPGATLTLTTPFHVKLPAVFSRMGFEDGVYCITQWYPKPAVYDVNGWNPIPYLNQGEFYSEFGNFDVSITVPKNMLVAATGQVQDPKEKEWWLERSKNSKAKHFAEGQMKTLRFVQESVHDFAWFGSTAFMSDRSEVTLDNGQKVETWIFGKPGSNLEKPRGVKYINSGVKYYSQKVGNYPYSIAQVVITPLKAGGGMEYPTITNCATNDETVIVHEVGHNWFYGILGSNERDYPWMDESFNTYYENRHAREKDPEDDSEKGIHILSALGKIDQADFLFKYASRKNIDQPGNISSTLYTDNNYGAIIYAKNPLAFGYLQAYLGDSLFDAMMHAYFEKWKFKHPLPNDFRQHAEAFTQLNLNWFFEGVLGSTQKLDYKMVSAKEGSVTVKNKGSLVAPLAISVINEDSVLHTFWYDGFTGTKTLQVPNYPFTQQSLTYRIDGNKKTTDLYRQNNTVQVRGTCENCSKIKLQPLANLETDHATQVFFAPVYAYNVYNKSMLGIAFYNSLFPQKRNEFLFMPVYSFQTKDLNGYASYWHNFYTEGKIRNIQLGFHSARFATKGLYYNSGTSDTLIQSVLNGGSAYYGNITYEKFAPFVKISLQPKNRRSLRENTLMLRYVMVNEQAADRSYFYQFGKDHFGISEITYQFADPNVLRPFSANIGLQSGIHNVNFQKLSLEINQSIKYKKGKSKAAQIRLFAGGFLFEKTAAAGSRDDNYAQRVYLQGGANAGQNDYLYDQAMMGREEHLGNISAPNPANTSAQNIWGRQVLYTQSGFRNFASVGSSNTFLTSANFTIPFPIPVPLGIYYDISYFNAPGTYDNLGNYTKPGFKSASVGGVYLNIKDVFGIYLPIISTSNVEDYWNTNGYKTIFSRASFVFNLNKLSPVRGVRDIKM